MDTEKTKLTYFNKGTCSTYQKVVIPKQVLKYQAFNTVRNVQNPSIFYFEPRLATTISSLPFPPPPPAQCHFLALLLLHKTALISSTNVQATSVAEEKKKDLLISVLLLKTSY